jgi:antirestriction protein ArdC
MTDLTYFEAQVEDARRAFVQAEAARSSDANQLYADYLNLQAEYNHAWTADQRERLFASREGVGLAAVPEEGVLLRVLDEEWNEMGLASLYFAQRVRETTGAPTITAEDFWQIVATDNWREVQWASVKPIDAAIIEINALLSGAEIIQEMATPVDIPVPEETVDAEPIVGGPAPVRARGGRRDIADEVTNKIIEQLEAGVVPWHQPWASTGNRLPVSLSTRRNYRGTNAMLLGISAQAHGYTSPLWGTFRQIKELGGAVTKGEHSTMVIFYKPLIQEATNAAGELSEERKGAVLRAYNVFNLSQTTGLEHLNVIEEDLRTEHERITQCEKAMQEYLTNGGPEFAHDGGDRAFYSPSRDRVSMPELERFESAEAYYATAFHELCHSTGHSSRLDRNEHREDHYFGSPSYATEELLAECGSAMACASLGSPQSATIAQSAAYIENWLNALRNDTSLVMKAAAGAQKAVEHMGLSLEREVTHDEEMVVAGEVAIAPETIRAPERTAEVNEKSRVVAHPNSVTLDSLEAEVRHFQKCVYEAGNLPPEDIARQDLEADMSKYRRQLAALEPDAREEWVFAEMLKTAEQRYEVLVGRVDDPLTRLNIIFSSQIAHAGDSQRLSEASAKLEARREELFQLAYSEPHPWVVEIDDTGFDSLPGVAEYREKWGVHDWNDPLGEGFSCDEQEQERAALEDRLLLAALEHLNGWVR